MDKLKPCPCCGSERVDTLKGNWLESEKPFWKVWCKSCQLRTWCEPTRKGAISVWNARATDPTLAAAEAKLAHFEELAGERLVQISDDADRIAALEEALEPLADIVTAFSADRYDHHQDLVLMEAGDARRAAALLKEKE